MTRSCRLCGARPGSYRTVTVGDGLARRWSVCDRCVETLSELPGVTVSRPEDSERVVLRVEPEALVGVMGRDDQ